MANYIESSRSNYFAVKDLAAFTAEATAARGGNAVQPEEPRMNAMHAVQAAIAAIHLHPTNPRRNSDKAALDSLTASVKEHGVLQPILLRAHGDGEYEIVAGERRYSAAKAAGHDTIPAVVGHFDDKQVGSIQMIENLQRADLHPVDEAQGFRDLMDVHGYSVDDVAATCARSKAYVFQRLQLTNLTDASRKAFLGQKLLPGVAFVVARIREPKSQDAFLRELLGRQKDRGELISPNDASHMAQRDFMLQLRNAPFAITDAKLVPGCGSCTDCPKRTGNSKDLFGEVRDEDVCTDPPCFETKVAAHKTQQIEKAKKRGGDVITGAEAKKLVQYGSITSGAGYVDASKPYYGDGKHSNKTYRAIAGKGVKLTLIEDERNNTFIEAIAIKDSEALRDLFKNRRSSNPGRQQDAERERKRKAEQTVRTATFAAIAEQFDGTLKPELISFLLHRMFTLIGSDDAKRLHKLWEPETKADSEYTWKKAYEAKLLTLSPVDAAKRLLQVALVNELYVAGYSKIERSELLEGAATIIGIDHAAIRKSSLAPAVKATQKAKGPAKRKAA
jgi:ParB/RepB/Spo0J family partition protein